MDCDIRIYDTYDKYITAYFRFALDIIIIASICNRFLFRTLAIRTIGNEQHPHHNQPTTTRTQIRWQSRPVNRFADLKDANIPVMNNQSSFKVSQFHRSMMAARGPTIDRLQQTCLGDPQLNFVQLLHELSLEHLFDVTYVDIDERTYDGQYQCFVQLSTLPVAVVAGQGNTYQDAHLAAAHNSLQYLKIMTKV